MAQLKKVDVKVPAVGESIVEANIGKWFFKGGDWVEKDGVLLELETDKATVEVVSPESGILEIKVASGETVPIGATIGWIEPQKEKPKNLKSSSQIEDSPAEISKKSASMKNLDLKETQNPSASNQISQKVSSELSLGEDKDNVGEKPLVQSTSSVDPFKGLGPSNRKALREGKKLISDFSFKKAEFDQRGEEDGLDEGVSDEERKPMSFLRQKIAERLMGSQKNTATLTTFNEVDLSQVVSLRKKLKQSFEVERGVKLGFMSFFVKALCYARDSYPTVCARIDEKDIVYSKNFHISMAVSTERGLVVPVLRHVDKLSYSGIEKLILEISEKARTGKLTPDSMQGGHITLSNGGVFGSLLSTPILNPPQSAILGVHKMEMRPQAIQSKDKKDYTVEIRPMMYLALSYDHRIIDGSESVGFLVKVKEYLETVKEDLIF